MNTPLIDTLRDPTVRDLAWAIGSPGLLESTHPDYGGQVVDDAWFKAQLQESRQWLTSLDMSPLPLHNFIAARPTRRLGHYFESLIAYWLAHIPGTQLIATNLQVQNEQRTLGEFDFLFRDASATVCHWEAAVKFYLQVEPVAEQRAFIGPGTRDRLDLKLARIFQHQLLLGHTPAGQQALPRGIRLDKAQAFVKGYLFYPAATPRPASAHGISAAHLSGWWARHAQEKLPQTAENSRWIILPRMRWLAPALLANDAQLMSDTMLNSRLETHFSLGSEALLVVEMQLTTEKTWREISRGFVVCSSWPVLGEAADNLSIGQPR